MYAWWNHGTIEVHSSVKTSVSSLIYMCLEYSFPDLPVAWHFTKVLLNQLKAKEKQTRRTLWIYTTFPGILPSSSRSSKEPWLDRFLLSRIGTEMLTSHYVASMEAWSGGDVGFPTWTSDIQSGLPPESWTILYILLSTDYKSLRSYSFVFYINLFGLWPEQGSSIVEKDCDPTIICLRAAERARWLCSSEVLGKDDSSCGQQVGWLNKFWIIKYIKGMCWEAHVCSGGTCLTNWWHN